MSIYSGLLLAVYVVFVISIQCPSQQKGCHIETFTMVIDCESVSFPKHYYWPGIRMMIKVNYIIAAIHQ